MLTGSSVDVAMTEIAQSLRWDDMDDEVARQNAELDRSIASTSRTLINQRPQSSDPRKPVVTGVIAHGRR